MAGFCSQNDSWVLDPLCEAMSQLNNSAEKLPGSGCGLRRWPWHFTGTGRRGSESGRRGFFPGVQLPTVLLLRANPVRSGFSLSALIVVLPLPGCVTSDKLPTLSGPVSSSGKGDNAHRIGLCLWSAWQYPAHMRHQYVVVPSLLSPTCSQVETNTGREPSQGWGPSESSSAFPPSKTLPSRNPLLIPFFKYQNNQLKWLKTDGTLPCSRSHSDPPPW